MDVREIGRVNSHLPALSYLCTMQQVIFEDLGRKAYKETWDYQELLLKKNVERKSVVASKQYAGEEDEANSLLPTQHWLLFVEHPPVYTLGKSGDEKNILISDQQLKINGIEFYHINRGGDITFHGPGQLVGYPILDLDKFKTDIGWYLRSLEEVIILTMAEYGLAGERSKGETGVWIEPGVNGKERKICAMGIKCSRWITMHGFAFNVNTDLGYFNNIIPCGIQNKQVTSLEKELGKKVSMDEVKEKVKRNFEKVFECRVV
jgi:lipoyl(octanoyl) transferase